MCITDCHDMTFAVKVVLNLNTNNQQTKLQMAISLWLKEGNFSFYQVANLVVKGEKCYLPAFSPFLP